MYENCQDNGYSIFPFVFNCGQEIILNIALSKAQDKTKTESERLEDVIKFCQGQIDNIHKDNLSRE